MSGRRTQRAHWHDDAEQQRAPGWWPRAAVLAEQKRARMDEERRLAVERARRARKARNRAQKQARKARR